MELAATPSMPPAPRPERPRLPGTVAGLLLASLGLTIVLLWARAPLAVLAVPALVLGTTACVLRPGAVMALVFALGGFIGTIIAFLGLPVDALAEALLLCLWIAVAGAYLTGHARNRVWLLPALVPLILYAAVTGAQLLTSESLAYAFADFRITVWYMLAVVLLAVAPWPSRTFRWIVLAFCAVALAVGLYALYRYIVGPSPEEFVQARASVQRVAFSVPTRFFGSFLSAFQLTAWCGVAVPFLLAVSFVADRRWRLVAVAAIGLCAFAIFASDVRTGLVATVAGSAVVMALLMVSQAFAIKRFAMAFFAVLGITVVGLAGYTVVISGSEVRSDRWSRILNPGEDPAWQERLARWEAALKVVDEEPFGHGLGTQGYVGQSQNPRGQTGPFNLDSAYLKVGIQQGWAVMVLFVVAQLTLLAGLGWRAMRTHDPWRAALGIGACGTLVVQMILFLNGIYSEGVTSLSAWLLIGIGVAQFTSPERLAESIPVERRSVAR